MAARALILTIAILAASTGVSFSTRAAGGFAPQEFLSWYDGWFNHHVWGIGVQWGYHEGTFIQCGTRRIPVRAVYDTHASREQPTPDQSKEHVSAANLALLRSLEVQGLKCLVSASPRPWEPPAEAFTDSETVQDKKSPDCCKLGGESCTSYDVSEPRIEPISGKATCPPGYSLSIDHYIDGTFSYICLGEITEVKCSN